MVAQTLRHAVCQDMPTSIRTALEMRSCRRIVSASARPYFPVAGLGTRFLPATKAMPKEMLTVVDRPVIQHVVDEARAAGIEHFIFVTGRNKGVIEDHFDSQFELERTLAGARQDERARAAVGATCRRPAQTSFTRQQAPLGLGHAVWCAREHRRRRAVRAAAARHAASRPARPASPR